MSRALAISNLPAGIGYVNVLDYMVGGATNPTDKTAELARLQQAVTDAFAQGRQLLVPPSTATLRVNGTVLIPDGGLSIIGEGTIRSTADAPLFKLVGGSINHDYRDVQAVFELGGVLPTAACVLELASPGSTNYINYNRFENLRSTGALAAVVSSSATRTTSNGQESSVNWNKFSDCKNYDTGAGDARNVVWFKTGSGTGNTFIGFKGNLGAVGSAYARFDGVGAVVGDILMSQGHFCATGGGSIDCAALEIGPGTLYRGNIAVDDCQSDAQLTRVFRIGSGAVAPANVHHDGSLIGGATILGIDVPMQSMRLSDRDGGTWEGGQAWATNATGAQTIAVCKVTLAANRGVRLSMVLDGVVGGVAAGTAKVDISLRSDGSTVTATTISTSADPAAIFGVSYSIAGLVATVNITFTPSATGSSGTANWNATGNGFCVQRLP